MAKKYYLDRTPVELLSKKDRQQRFDEEIGPDLDKLTEEELKKVRKAYMLDED